MTAEQMEILKDLDGEYAKMMLCSGNVNLYYQLFDILNYKIISGTFVPTLKTIQYLFSPYRLCGDHYTRCDCERHV